MANKQNPWVTVPEILEELDIPRRTWQRWRARGATPPCYVLPNRKIRIRRRDYETWLAGREEGAA